jgi:hypothetical protein
VRNFAVSRNGDRVTSQATFIDIAIEVIVYVF